MNQTAQRLFAPIASDYERWARILSVGQDGRWRQAMVNALRLPEGSSVLDVAAGTGSITRLLQAKGYRTTPVDLTFEMLALHPGPARVQARAETLPFGDECFDGVTSGYLLRYVDDPVACLRELKRVVRPGGIIGMIEFGFPSGIWRAMWRLYSGRLLPSAGRLIGPGWHEVGRFLGTSIEEFHRRHPDLPGLFTEAGWVDVRVERPSLGGGLALWGRRP